MEGPVFDENHSSTESLLEPLFQKRILLIRLLLTYLILGNTVTHKVVVSYLLYRLWQLIDMI